MKRVIGNGFLDGAGKLYCNEGGDIGDGKSVTGNVVALSEAPVQGCEKMAHTQSPAFSERGDLRSAKDHEPNYPL